MNLITLDASAREAGKRTARAARRAFEIPCVLYGRQQETVSFQVAERELSKLIYTNEFHRVEVKVGSEAYDCILKKIDFHPVTDRPMHADFQVLQTGEMITLTVPVRPVGTAVGVRDGGRTFEPMHEIEITCLPKDIPEHIEVDVTDVAIGDAIHVSDLHFPEVTFNVAEDTVLFAVLAARLEEIEEEVEDELGEGEEEDGEDEDAEEDES